MTIGRVTWKHSNSQWLAHGLSLLFDHVMEGGASAIGNPLWWVHYAREEHLSGGAVSGPPAAPDMSGFK